MLIAIGACEQAAEGQRLEELLAGVTVTQDVLESHRFGGGGVSGGDWECGLA
jgi:hypothetical protein